MNNKANITDELLTVKELSSKVKMAEGTIRNLIWKKVFQENIHYVKPTPRKILFIWSRVEVWLYGDESIETGSPTKKNCQTKSLINI